jgi:hypothetical protein
MQLSHVTDHKDEIDDDTVHETLHNAPERDVPFRQDHMRNAWSVKECGRECNTPGCKNAPCSQYRLLHRRLTARSSWIKMKFSLVANIYAPLGASWREGHLSIPGRAI